MFQVMPMIFHSLRGALGDLAATKARWLIGYWHHPPYTHGTHNSDKERRHFDMRENFLPLLEASGVDLTFGGHSHTYERSILMHGHYGTSDTYDAAQHAAHLLHTLLRTLLKPCYAPFCAPCCALPAARPAVHQGGLAGPT